MSEGVQSKESQPEEGCGPVDVVMVKQLQLLLEMAQSGRLHAMAAIVMTGHEAYPAMNSLIKEHPLHRVAMIGSTFMLASILSANEHAERVARAREAMVPRDPKGRIMGADGKPITGGRR